MKSLLFSWPFWVCFIYIIVLINTHLGSSLCLQNQRSILLQLRTSLEFERSESTKLSTWNQTLDCCQWNGVQCNSFTGNVIGLDLSAESITNSSDNMESLFSLQFLQSLNLANNNFNNKEIPPGFGKLAALTYLNLSNAGFSGQVPLDISQLMKLVTLDLSSLSLLGSSQLIMENPSLAMLVRKFTNLRGLYLSDVDISASGAEWCKALSSSVPNLQFLSLSNCNLSGEIDASLKKLRSLSEIRLDQNSLTAPVPDFIADFRNLTTLKLSYCQLNGTFPQKIFKVATLRSLDLSYNVLLHGTLPEFPSNSALQTLVVSYTSFSGELPKSIGNLMQLQRMELQNCSFSGSIPSMGQLNQLVYVDFSNNKFSGLVPSFASAKNLVYLSLSNNRLSGSITSMGWASLSNLVTLDLSSNSLQGNVAASFFGLPSLLSVQLHLNKLTGPLGGFKISSPIQTLDLSFNRLEGPIQSVFKLQSLRVLKLSNNRFNGSVDLSVIQQIKNLSVLELSYNSLEVSEGSTGSNSFPELTSLRLASCSLRFLPTFLIRQSKINNLDLSNNQIKGKIPRWIWTVGNQSLSLLNLSWNNFIEVEPNFPDTPYLRVLDLKSNKLQGVVPKLPSSAFYLDFSNNSFSSIIPANIDDFPIEIYLFSLSRNNIPGSIPKSFCNHTQIQVLDLSYNRFEGTIPSCLISTSRALAVLNVRGNNLSGNFPDTFPKSCKLRTLDVNANKLEGSVPRSLANCESLEVLDLGNNHLSDTYPLWLKNLIQLRVLVLRFNDFHGSITCPDDSIWPMVQIIDLAYNNFEGKMQRKCFLEWKAMMVGGDQSYIYLQYGVPDAHYQNVVSVTYKGFEFQLLKILTMFTSIDFSSNKFHGEIPQEIGNLHNIRVLNLSHNSFSSAIPSSIGNLTSLESLDLSHNLLSGEIPTQLTQLSFLEVLNFSYNKLVGPIPSGNQFSTFDASSYEHNQDLCGQPLNKLCSDFSPLTPSKTSTQKRSSSHTGTFDWQNIFIGSGFGTGAALVIAPLVFWKKGRLWLDERVNKIVAAFLLACGIDNVPLNEGRPRPEDGIGHQLFNFTSYHEDTEDKEGDFGSFCVFCSKLDIERKMVIHNPSCTCYGSPSILSSFSLSLSL